LAVVDGSSMSLVGESRRLSRISPTAALPLKADILTFGVRGRSGSILLIKAGSNN
jgi:hypothetical protein